MDLVSLARDIGRELQNDEVYINYQLAQQACENDKELQEAIKDFNIKRALLNNAAQAGDNDDKELQELNIEFRNLYSDIMRNENMARYNMAKTEIDNLVRRLTGIISLCAQGEDPKTCDYDPSVQGCGPGGCSGCSGCG